MANDPMLLEIRDRLIDRIDRRLAVILTGSLVVHVAIASLAWAHDVELAPERAYVAVPLFQQDVIDVTLPDPVVAPNPVPGHGGIAKPTTTKGHARSIVLPAPVNGQSLAGLLTNAEETRTAPTLSLLSIDAHEQAHPSIGNGTQTSRTDDEVRPASLPAPTIADDQTLTHVTRDNHERPPGRVIPGTVKPEQTTTLTPAAVLDIIQSTYLAGLQRCYRLGLAQDATLSGRVSISFTVDERGRVTDPDASGLSSQVDSCISDQMTRWRFPVPKDKSGATTDAAFSVSLALQPS